METIVKVFGGIFIGEDCNENTTTVMYSGLLNPEDGLPYFLRQAIIENKVIPDSNTIGDLEEFIIKWNKTLLKKELWIEQKTNTQ